MSLFYSDKLKSKDTNKYGIVDASQVSGHKTVQNLSDLYTLSDAILSESGENANNDALGQLWYVAGESKRYELIDWASRNAAEGWREFKMDVDVDPSLFISSIKTIEGQSLVGEGDLSVGDINAMGYVGVVNVFSNFDRLFEICNDIKLGESVFAVPSTTDDFSGHVCYEFVNADGIPANISYPTGWDEESYLKWRKDTEDETCMYNYVSSIPLNYPLFDRMLKDIAGKVAEFLGEEAIMMGVANKLGYLPVFLDSYGDRKFNIPELKYVANSKNSKHGAYVLHAYDILLITKLNYPIFSGITVPTVLIKAVHFGADGISDFKGPRHRYTADAQECLKTPGIYPWVETNVPIEGRPFTIISTRTSDADDNGYYTSELTAYGRQGEGEIYKIACAWNLDEAGSVSIADTFNAGEYNGWTKISVEDSIAFVNSYTTNADSCTTSGVYTNVYNNGPHAQSSSKPYTVVTNGAFIDQTTGTAWAEQHAYPYRKEGNYVRDYRRLIDTSTSPITSKTAWTPIAEPLINRAEADANLCIETGVYPWAYINTPVGNDGAFTIIVKRTDDFDNNGYWTIEQTAYGRQGEEVNNIYKRLIFYKPPTIVSSDTSNTTSTTSPATFEVHYGWNKINSGNSVATATVNSINRLSDGTKEYSMTFRTADNNSIFEDDARRFILIDNQWYILHTNIDYMSSTKYGVTITVQSLIDYRFSATCYVETTNSDLVKLPNATFTLTGDLKEYLHKEKVCYMNFPGNHPALESDEAGRTHSSLNLVSTFGFSFNDLLNCESVLVRTHTCHISMNVQYLSNKVVLSGLTPDGYEKKIIIEHSGSDNVTITVINNIPGAVNGEGAVVFGSDNEANGDYSIAAGSGLTTTHKGEAAFGVENTSYTGDTAADCTQFSVGIGQGVNAIDVRANGDIYFGGVKVWDFETQTFFPDRTN